MMIILHRIPSLKIILHGIRIMSPFEYLTRLVILLDVSLMWSCPIHQQFKVLKVCFVLPRGNVLLLSPRELSPRRNKGLRRYLIKSWMYHLNLWRTTPLDTTMPKGHYGATIIMNWNSSEKSMDMHASPTSTNRTNYLLTGVKGNDTKKSFFQVKFYPQQESSNLLAYPRIVSRLLIGLVSAGTCSNFIGMQTLRY